MSYAQQGGAVENGAANAEITPMYLPDTLETRLQTALNQSGSTTDVTQQVSPAQIFVCHSTFSFHLTSSIYVI
jgi:hypothetical protein